MARKSEKKENRDELTQYTFEGEKRLNIPQTGLVSAGTDPINGKKTYMFDPHLDPELQWAGKTEGTSFEVDTVSLHVHERIDPLTIIEAVRNKEPDTQRNLFYYFEEPENNLPIREAIEFYKHSEGWSNRLIAGDSLIVMNSLLEKEGMARKVQMIYIDPPYGIKYGSNFQPFVNKRDVRDGKAEDLTQEPETVKAFRDTWELGIHSYLTYLRDRLLLAKDLLSETGSIFVQMNDENLHHVREIMDEVFGNQNFVAIITYQTATNQNTKTIQRLHDYLIWYSKTDNPKVRHLFRKYTQEERANIFNNIDSKNRRFKAAQFRDNWTKSQIENLRKSDRIYGKYVKRFETDFEYTEYDTVWNGTVISTFSKEKVYAVQTSTVPIKRCILMTTDPGDLVLDITCGSGTTAYVAEQYGRRWITCDTSRVSITLSKQRLMTSIFDFYELAHKDEGVSSGFNYEKVPHITLSSIANEEPHIEEILYDKPIIDRTKKRVTGPFTVEAVPSQRVVNLEEVEENSSAQDPDNTIPRTGETIRQSDWIDELSRTGIRSVKGKENIKFVRIGILQGTKWLQAEGETEDGQRAVISFGPTYAPLEQRQVELAIEEAQQLVPKPKLVIFASFQFDPEAAKDIDELKWPEVSVIKCQMNTDLLTEDLKQKKANEESSFWLIGQPDIELTRKEEKYIVTVNGFDYYDTRTGEIKSGNPSNIAMWELDTDYNGRSLYPRQVFFPLEGENGGWSKLTKALRAYVDEDLISSYSGNQSLPFKAGRNKQIAIKIIDDRGIESLRVLKVD
ncbi:site-specific DNA-methyltransferase [Cuniculiplasma divulgatum]|jgi:adenine-specific DNA-methyltransferase|uniref:Adenine specific DNA methylase Mod n=1 Tax=Cuniculiplasma divulgatum TaxID=1673428 RepID=A0A1N5S5J2_9ARCH|nr:site-specific DNA-methyltransferase [Cuniculiplasma divulgatum]SIM31197.1 adenine specific DNA methylase Mod [Cuniculiplasma divulgatum]